MLDTRISASCGTWVEVTPFPIAFDVPYCMTKSFRNDSPNQINVDLPQVYANKHVPVKLNIDIRSYPLVTKDEPSQAQLVSELEQIQDERGTTLLTTPIPVPPYSEGCVHWDLIPEQAAIRGIWAVPYRKYKQTGAWFANFLLAIHKPLLDAIMRRHRNQKKLLVEAAIEAWVKGLEKAEGEEKEIWRWNDVIRIGDIWVLYLQLAGQGPMPYLRNIPQPVTVRVVLVTPDGSKTPTDATVDCEPVQALTTLPPPMPSAFSADIPKDGKQIFLGKGWRWRITVTSPGSGSKEINVPPTSSVTIETHVSGGMPPDG